MGLSPPSFFVLVVVGGVSRDAFILKGGGGGKSPIGTKAVSHPSFLPVVLIFLFVSSTTMHETTISPRSNVPQKFKGHKNLGRWVMRQRELYWDLKRPGGRKYTDHLSQERIEHLETAGFFWRAVDGRKPKSRTRRKAHPLLRQQQEGNEEKVREQEQPLTQPPAQPPHPMRQLQPQQPTRDEGQPRQTRAHDGHNCGSFGRRDEHYERWI